MKRNKKKTEEKLSEYSKEYRVAFAARCAIKAQPFLSNVSDKHLFSIIFAADTAAAYATNANTDTAANAAAAADTAATDADTTSTDTMVAFAAAAAAAANAPAAAAAANYVAANYSNESSSEYDLKTIEDLNKIEQSNNVNDYMFSPLYKGNIPNSHKKQIEIYKNNLEERGFGFWAIVFQDYLDGNMTIEKLKTRVCIDKSIIQQGGLEATQYIEKLYE